jgi:hypothetical protein
MSYNINPTGLFPGPDETGNTSPTSHPYTFLDANASITLGAAESGMYIPLANLSDQFSTSFANEALPTADYRYLIWAIVDQATDYHDAVEVQGNDVPAGVQLVKGPLYGEGTGVTQLFKQKMWFSGGALTLIEPDAED